MSTASDVPSARSLRVDFHTHTHYSADGCQSPAALVARARAVALDRVAVTDHHTLDGALRARDLDPTRIIVGEEITARDGTDVLGLYLTRRIPPGQPLEAVIETIRDQGGVVILPHPFAYLRHAAARASRALPLVDAVEVWNSRAFYGPWNARALAAARELGLPVVANTDGHLSQELGRAWTVLPSFVGPASLRIALKYGRPMHDGPARFLPHLASRGLVWWHRLAGTPATRPG